MLYPTELRVHEPGLAQDLSLIYPPDGLEDFPRGADTSTSPLVIHTQLIRRKISPVALRFGLFMAAAAAGTTAVGIFLGWQVLRGENRAYLQQSIGDTTHLLSEHVQSEVVRIQNLTHDLATNTVVPLYRAFLSQQAQGPKLAKGKAAKASKAPAPDAPPVPAASEIDADEDLLSLELWSRGNSTGVFDTTPAEPQRVYVLMNTRFTGLDRSHLQALSGLTAQEPNWVRPAFGGNTMLLSVKLPAIPGLTAMSLPVDANFVILAYWRLGKVVKSFVRQGMAVSALVDRGGEVLAHADPKWVVQGASVATTPLYRAAVSSPTPAGQLEFKDSTGQTFFGGFRKIDPTSILVLSTISETEASAGLAVMKKRSIVFLLLSFGLWLASGYLLAAHGYLSRIVGGPAFGPGQGTAGSSRAPTDTVPTETAAPSYAEVGVVYGTLRQLAQMLEGASPEVATEALNDYWTLARTSVEEYGGLFEREGSASFVGIFGVPHREGTESWKAMRCALDLRTAFKQLNEARKVDGAKALSFSIGVHVGKGLAARLGPVHHLRYSVIGEVLTCARSLSQITVMARTDLLVSQEAWLLSEGRFVGEQVGEAKLTVDTGLTTYFTLRAYRDEQGQEIEVPGPTVESGDAQSDMPPAPVAAFEQRPARWLVNNGSQIVGPLTPQEIAARLHAQELDFDCECWAEGTGSSSQIKSAKIFSGSEDEGADLWLFDQSTIHGPVSAGFIKTAVIHGAIAADGAFVCRGSTIHGWQKLSDWDPALGGAGAPAQLRPPKPSDALNTAAAPVQPPPPPADAETAGELPQGDSGEEAA